MVIDQPRIVAWDDILAPWFFKITQIFFSLASRKSQGVLFSIKLAGAAIVNLS